MSNHTKIEGQIDGLEKTTQNKIKKAVSRKSDEAKKLIKSTVADFCEDIEGVLDRYLEDFDTRSFVKKVNSQIDLDIDEKSLFSGDDESGEGNNDDYGIFDFAVDVVGGIFVAYGDFLANVITFGGARRDDLINALNNRLSEIRDGFDPKPFFELIYNRKDEVLSTVKTMVIDELLKPLQEQIEDILGKESSREKDLAAATNKEADLSARVKTLKEQISQINFSI